MVRFNSPRLRIASGNGDWIGKCYQAISCSSAHTLERQTDGAQALYHAARYEHPPEPCRILLENGSDVNVQCGGYYGNALQAACSGGHLEKLKLLVDKGHYVHRS